MSDYAHRMMGLYSPYDEALFSDYQDHLAEQSYYEDRAMQEEAVKPGLLYQLRRRLADWIDPGMPF